MTAQNWAEQLGLRTAYDVPKPTEKKAVEKHSDSAIQVVLFPDELEVRLTNLMQATESGIQEMGTNILYLAFGFLEWYENTTNNARARFAPLFLVPARLQKGRLNQKTKTYEYTISYSGEDILPNLSLREKLRSDFALALPDLDENSNPEAYFEDVQSMIQDNQPRWRVRRFITLSLLNFSKLLMYLDLDPSTWPAGASLLDHPVVTEFLSGYKPDQEDAESDTDLGFGEEHSIDNIKDVHERYPLIDDADSSQHSALIDALDGKNLVIEGPPGTGKSQTITNLIAAAMAQGKRVLFVAEKLAALEVVRRKLDAAGLGEFCLELHSHKSQRRKVLDEVEARLNKHGRYRNPEDIDIDILRYEELKTTLQGHAERINQPWKNTGKTLQEIFMAATRYRVTTNCKPGTLHPEGHDGSSLDIPRQRRMKDDVKTFRKVYQGVSGQLDGSADLPNHPWYGACNIDLQLFDLESVQSALTDWQEALCNLAKKRMNFAEALGCEPDIFADSVSGLSILLEELKSLPSLQGNELLDSLPVLKSDILKKAQQYLHFSQAVHSCYTELTEYVQPDVLKELSVVKQFTEGNAYLQKLVGYPVTLKELAGAIKKLQVVHDQLVALEKPIRKIQNVIGKEAAEHLALNIAGLREFTLFVDLVSKLHPSYWRLRHECFDNEEMDELLPKLHDDLTPLRTLHDELQHTFRLDELPRADILRQLRTRLDSGGVLRWFQGDWRRARKQLFGLSKDAQIEFSQLFQSLNAVEKYSRRLEEFQANSRYQEVFGDHLKGIDTDLPALESLREWYRAVRQQYGIGFTQKAALGDAILTLPVDFARSIRSLSDKGIQNQVNDLLNQLIKLREVFSPVKKLQNDSTILIGKQGILTLLLATLNKALVSCKPLLIDDALTTTELAHRIERLDWLRKAVTKLEAADYDNKLFQGRLGLKFNSEIDNGPALSILKNTLAAAESVEQLSNKAVQQKIYSQPETTTFKKLTDLTVQLHNAATYQSEKYNTFNQLLKLDLQSWIKLSGDRLDALISRNDHALKNGESLQNWLGYVRVREQLKNNGLDKLAVAVENGVINPMKVDSAYKAGLFDLLAREILHDLPELGLFSGNTQEALQEQFREYDNRLKELQREKIAWQIDQADIPAGNTTGRASDLTELALLQRECSKKTRHIPIRQLLWRASNALVALKPCFLMGPMSVAQYLQPGQIEFDMVVMDEASQIKPQDALGAIARGKQLVVVGDPKQLPPTSFFDRLANNNDEEVTTIEESESILDATLPMFSLRRLRWHYRSQHESLIAFSNRFFYDEDLVLFPSPCKKSDEFGIQYSRVQAGCFVNSKNSEEAKVVAEAVRDHFKKYPNESLGVVAMSVKQRLQIAAAVEALSKEDGFFQQKLEEDSGKRESLFIKNLENVQGDERDVIIISMTYGPNEPGGKVFQRFGPINSDVGWRRLNVLFTRSKKRMHIFSSMGSGDIIISPTTKRGVQALRDFLAYCETGILHTTERNTDRQPDSDFEVAVMMALRNKGFECVPQVGVAGFFIDVAVVDPGNSGSFLMGIECDGATYHSAKSTRDRDRLRQAVLERLGWKIRRIWSTDWFRNPQAELKPIVSELNALKTKSIKARPIEEIKIKKAVQEPAGQPLVAAC